jgi:S-adenosylmethionine decarboxylase
MNQTNYWGLSQAINLHECDHDILVDEELLKKFVIELVKKIGMVAHGPCLVERFGEGALHGLSAMQFIETSSITVHLDDVGNRAFVDIFSCKHFDTDLSVKYAQEYFGAQSFSETVIDR